MEKRGIAGVLAKAHSIVFDYVLIVFGIEQENHL